LLSPPAFYDLKDEIDTIVTKKKDVGWIEE
jgi:hypothetical protein